MVWEEINVVADVRAKVALWELISDEREEPTLDWNHARLYLPTLLSNGRILQISSNLHLKLYHYLVQRDLIKYWIDKQLIPEDVSSIELDL